MATASHPIESFPESFAALFEESLLHQEMRTGEVITAEVISVDANFVVVNAGLKSESLIAAEEFHNDKGEIEVKPGDFVAVAIEALEDGMARQNCRVKKPNVLPHGMTWKWRWNKARWCMA